VRRGAAEFCCVCMYVCMYCVFVFVPGTESRTKGEVSDASEIRYFILSNGPSVRHISPLTLIMTYSVMDLNFFYY
jgi:hypothetical protein